ncbi:longitudinals lacking protein, isoforms A/B/D/L isoform X5 [Hermetia illucens]|uniref:longitudinals lacking protein, isoforms A/B/D/L isoform X5 n=1 Tax=Hermetia illucens TaxID=343691 RepID=UPI0018CC5C7C|nr:longitudinals lacking protein, isoforms A/B/D/L isoform X5 [Hermetia illucens]
MDDDQQFCLRWNNHQSTLISVFDTLLENGTLVDCTLAAEGKFLKAHKVVLSACSPYFATLLSQQYDKHPIFILKDVKFQELRAMMDYMYRGEVNISQDQLAALLKAAESLQIKGLSDSRGGASSAVSGSAGICASQKSDHKALSVPVTSGPIKSNSPSGGYTIEQKRPRHAVGASSSIESQAGSREGSSSPTSRKRKRIRRRSMDNLTIDNHEHSNSSSQSMQINSSVAPSNTSTAMGSVPSSVAVSQAIVTQQTGAVAGTSGIVTAGTNTGLNVTKKTDSVSSNAKLEGAEQEVDNDNGDEEDESGKLANMRKEQNKRKQHTSDVDQKDSGGEILIEPKSEYDDGNDETVEDLTLDDEELLEDLEQAGPSHGGGEGSSQGYAQWQVERSQDDVFMATQESAGQQRDPQVSQTSPQDIKFHQSMIVGDYSNERFPCAVCGKSYLRKRHLQRHMRDECIGIPPRFQCDLCPSRFRRKYHMVRHMTSKHGIPSPQVPSAELRRRTINVDESGIGNTESRSSISQAAHTTFGPYCKKEDFENDCKNFNFKQYENSNFGPADYKDYDKTVDDDWKMKLSLSLISNSLLKERLVNAIPFSYNNN